MLTGGASLCSTDGKFNSSFRFIAVHQARDYQQILIDGAFTFWRGGGKYVLIVLPTGGGKTFVFARIAALCGLSVCVIAHRGELVAQISLALAREGVRHRIIGPAALAKRCAAAHCEELQRSYVEPNARILVAGVDTLIKMSPDDQALRQVQLWIQDEAHHVLQANKWGKAAALFPNAYGLGVTATPVRADGKGLGAHADGLFQEMLVGPSMRDLIARGYLTDYRIFAPPSDLDLSEVTTSADGDYNRQKLAKARSQSHITGDVVEHYRRIAMGKLGVTFDVDVDSATETAAAFNAAGVPAAMVHGGTPDSLRAQILRDFKARRYLQLVNVDLFGEGFDLPAIEVVSMARPTQSYALFAQQFGRSLRVMDGKDRAIIIDHVGNTIRHGLPDAPREWSLDRRERRSRSAPTDVLPTRSCPQCTGVYERVYAACPYCGHEPPPAGRSTPSQVDGDLCELDPAVLAQMRGEITRVDGVAPLLRGAAPEVNGGIAKRHYVRQQAQVALRDAMATWSGWQTHLGRPLREQDRRFWFRYGVDKMSAQVLGEADALALAERINNDLRVNNVEKIA